jgi:sigma-B regulation protein RsbU (phosphoserine phosphatase)
LKAGTLVAAIKGLFNYPAPKSALTDRFHNWSSALKAMNLRSLFMAMTLVEVEGYCLKISLAGMPPVLIYRADIKAVEEVAISGMPLGSIVSYKYRQQDVRLSPGDIALLITDGLIERFNNRGEMFELDRVKDALIESASHSPQEIIDHLMVRGDEWADGRPQDDDATFVVLKVKSASL